MVEMKRNQLRGETRKKKERKTNNDMKISDTWINEDGIEMAWATPSRREIAAAKKAGREGVEVLAYCKAPRGWVISEDEDDGGNPGCYLIRARERTRKGPAGTSVPAQRNTTP